MSFSYEAIMYVLRTGCQWKALPKERFGLVLEEIVIDRPEDIEQHLCADTYMALLHMAAAIMAYRKTGVIFG
jgi:hypothetical protein